MDKKSRPTNINRTKIKCAIELRSNKPRTTRVKKINTTKIEVASTKKILEPKIGDKKASPRNKAVKSFAENVSITGLREACTESVKSIRYMFIIALIAALSMIVYQSIMIEQQYQKQETVFSDSETLNRHAPFPNVTICLPVSVDQNGFRREMVISSKADYLMKKHNITDNDVSDFLNGVLDHESKSGDLNSVLFRVTKEIADATQQSLLKRNESFSKFIFLPCTKYLLSNCAFGGVSFDCCDATRTVALMTSSCLQISVSIGQN